MVRALFRMLLEVLVPVFYFLPGEGRILTWQVSDSLGMQGQDFPRVSGILISKHILHLLLSFVFGVFSGAQVHDLTLCAYSCRSIHVSLSQASLCDYINLTPSRTLTNSSAICHCPRVHGYLYLGYSSFHTKWMMKCII